MQKLINLVRKNLAVFALVALVLAGSALAFPQSASAALSTISSGATYTRLVAVVQGVVTTTFLTITGATYGFGGNIPVPVALTATGPVTGGSLVPATTYNFKVSAYDGVSTTTVSNQVSTTTGALATNQVNITWGSVPGAKGYIVYFATSTNAFDHYIVATSTSDVPNTYVTIATTSSSKAGTAPTDNTAFAFKLNPNGNSFLNGGALGIGTSTPTTGVSLDTFGYSRSVTNATTTACSAALNGATFYNTANSHLWLCQSAAWVLIK